MSETEAPTLEVDLQDQVKEYLVQHMNESPRHRARGYFISQSFKRLIEVLDDEQIIEIKARRHVKNKSESYPSLSQGRVGDYTHTEEELRVAFNLDFHREKHGTFDSQAVLEQIKKKDLQDVPVEKLVYRDENSLLFDELEGVLTDVMGVKDIGEFEQPFYFVLEGKAADTKHMKQKVKDFNGAEYHDKDGLGWKFRTLDLMAIWSHRAYTDSQNILFTSSHGRRLNMYDVENLAFNRYETDEPYYGAVHAKPIINRWQSQIGTGKTDMRLWEWDSTEEWVREK